MLDPRLLYTFDPEVWASLDAERPVLLHLFEGYVDAASVNRGLSAHILAHCSHEVLAEFDHDQLHDYRSRRPQMVFDTNAWVSMNDFSLLLHKVIDADGTPFLLLTGPEPDTQWRRAAHAVLGIAERLHSALLLTAQGVPMAVPHTRPTLVTSHSTDPALATGNPLWIDRIQIPGSFSAMLEYRAGQAGLTGLGFVAHVPHYLAQSSFPQAIAAVLRRVNDAAGLNIPLGDLDDEAEQQLATIAAEVQEDSEFPAVLAALEEQYDQLSESGRTSVPTADEIGAAVEQFLAEQDGDSADGRG
ncbi:PAC2 family protein [Micropruina sonneratiae]|uniref:PAC2 family protein n=1 Tax=Micropruina sonneratiae TaxID=2986940 RepID=UPI0022266D51|nr:PAC2 family protein [Micropruina sp. KQZ13P-5]MCW3157854.1 PAC2 family protein [Micropruina sp. KQZ13P-5]